MNKSTVSVLLLLSFHTICLAQSGGFIVPNDSVKNLLPLERAIYLPKDGLTFFDSPYGDFAGRIELGSTLNLPGTPAPVPEHLKNMQASIVWRSIRPQALDLSFFFETYDDCYYVEFDKNENGFLRIINDNSASGWISIEKIKSAGFQIVFWMDFYGSIGKIITTPPMTKHPLRMSPYADAEVLVEIDEDHFEVQVIEYDAGLTREGYFCYVKATQFKVHPCYGGKYDEENIIKIYEGWLQIINSEGEPLIFHNSHGC